MSELGPSYSYQLTSQLLLGAEFVLDMEKKAEQPVHH